MSRSLIEAGHVALHLDRVESITPITEPGPDYGFQIKSADDVVTLWGPADSFQQLQATIAEKVPPRTVTLFQEVNELPAGALVMAPDGDVFERFSDGLWYQPGRADGVGLDELLRHADGEDLEVLHDGRVPR